VSGLALAHAACGAGTALECKQSIGRSDLAACLSLSLSLSAGTSWADHVRSWKHAEANGKAEILWVSYEALAKDAVHEVGRIAKFLGVASCLSPTVLHS